MEIRPSVRNKSVTPTCPPPCRSRCVSSTTGARDSTRDTTPNSVTAAQEPSLQRNGVCASPNHGQLREQSGGVASALKGSLDGDRSHTEDLGHERRGSAEPGAQVAQQSALDRHQMLNDRPQRHRIGSSGGHSCGTVLASQAECQDCLCPPVRRLVEDRQGFAHGTGSVAKSTAWRQRTTLRSRNAGR